MPSEEEKQEAQTPENSETGNAPGSEAQPAQTEKSGEKLFTQADLERQIDDRLKRERSKAEAQAQKAKTQAEEQRKAEQGEWQKLAEERKVQLEQLSAKSELADRLQEIVAKQLDAELKAWPESVRAIMPSDDSPLLERLEWTERTRPLANELMAAKGTQSIPSGTRFPAQATGGTGNKQVDLVAAFQAERDEQAKAVRNPLLRN